MNRSYIIWINGMPLQGTAGLRCTGHKHSPMRSPQGYSLSLSDETLGTYEVSGWAILDVLKCSKHSPSRFSKNSHAGKRWTHPLLILGSPRQLPPPGRLETLKTSLSSDNFGKTYSLCIFDKWFHNKEKL